MHDQTLLWIGCGGCSGETQALLGVEGQALDLLDLIDVDGLRLLWHPSLAEQDLRPVYHELVEGREHLTVLCVEGSVALAEDGMFDIADGAGKFRIVASLCQQADYVLAMGACAGYGGWQAQAPNPSGAGGLQYTLDTAGRRLPPGWRSRRGPPVTGVPGCPVPAETQVSAIRWALGALPGAWTGTAGHRWCSRACPAWSTGVAGHHAASACAAPAAPARSSPTSRTGPWCGGRRERRAAARGSAA